MVQANSHRVIGFVINTAGIVCLAGLSLACNAFDAQDPDHAALLVLLLAGQMQNMPGEEYSGGWTTTFDSSLTAFNRLAVNCRSETRALQFGRGNSIFKSIWSPATLGELDGLGPVYNQTACNGCHVLAGRGRPPDSGSLFNSMVFRISSGNAIIDGAAQAVLAYGLQLNDKSISGVPVEGAITISYVEEPGSYPDGTAYSLRRPDYSFGSWNFGTPGSFQYSPRVAPAVFGMGLLQAIPEDTLVLFSDAADSNGDGISGRLNLVRNPETGTIEVGRFGWKAGQATVSMQDQAALYNDIGITTAVYDQENCASGQTACASSPSGNDNSTPEIQHTDQYDLDFYMLMIAVPARRNWSKPEAQSGKEIFEQIGCGTCHRPLMRTGAVPDFPELAYQWIRPYSDLLLHDMGSDLADGHPEYQASGQEWRTPPLWGSGRYEMINGHRLLLHDGRARGFEEAILWHGGEANAVRDKFINLQKEDRAALIIFLESL